MSLCCCMLLYEGCCIHLAIFYHTHNMCSTSFYRAGDNHGPTAGRCLPRLGGSGDREDLRLPLYFIITVSNRRRVAAWQQNKEDFIVKQLLLLDFLDSLNPTYSEDVFSVLSFENKVVHLNVQ